MATQPPPARREIARIQEHTSGGTAHSIMFLIGFLAMVVAIFTDGSAIRLAAWGAIWTGWNVFWGVLLMTGRTRTYIVTRDDDPS